MEAESALGWPLGSELGSVIEWQLGLLSESP